MNKLKIVGVSSESYPGGRIDSFRIELSKESPHHSHIIPLFLDLGFPEKEVIDKLDTILQESDYLFVYGSPRIKAHLNMSGNILSINFDTSLGKEKIIKILDKYFEFSDR